MGEGSSVRTPELGVETWRGVEDPLLRTESGRRSKGLRGYTDGVEAISATWK